MRMGGTPPGTALGEWKRHWTLVVAAAFGCSSTGLSLYSTSAFMEPVTDEFGWSRTAFSAGTTILNLGAALSAVLIGTMIDRRGPRLTGICGLLFYCATIALIGTTTGSTANWLFLWFLAGIGAAWVQPTVWTSAVSSQFDASRGLAIALTISGSGIAAAILPVLSTWLIDTFGWRKAFAGIGVIWTLAVLPVLLLFFRGRYDPSKRPRPQAVANTGADLPGLTMAEGLRSATFYKMLIAAMLFVFAAIAIIVHMIPILHDRGLGRITAAAIAGIIGIASILGRFVAGSLIDRYRADRIARIAFMLPSLSALLLLFSEDITLLAVAAGLVGLSGLCRAACRSSPRKSIRFEMW